MRISDRSSDVCSSDLLPPGSQSKNAPRRMRCLHLIAGYYLGISLLHRARRIRRNVASAFADQIHRAENRGSIGPQDKEDQIHAAAQILHSASLLANNKGLSGAAGARRPMAQLHGRSEMRSARSRWRSEEHTSELQTLMRI